MARAVEQRETCAEHDGMRGQAVFVNESESD